MLFHLLLSKAAFMQVREFIRCRTSLAQANSECNFTNNELHCAKIRVLTTVAANNEPHFTNSESEFINSKMGFINRRSMQKRAELAQQGSLIRYFGSQYTSKAATSGYVGFN